METKKTKLNSAAIAEGAIAEEVKTKKVETAMEMAKRLEKEVEEYKEMVSSKKTQEELDELEKALMDEMDEFDKYIKKRVYDLPTGCSFEGKNYTRQDVAGKIIYFISKMEQTWQYVYGLYELCKLWKNTINQDTISYGALDSTLRLLDGGKFQGVSEWRDILIVNEFMKSMHEDYAKDTTIQLARAQKHDAIIKQRDLITPIKTPETHELEPIHPQAGAAE